MSVLYMGSTILCINNCIFGLPGIVSAAVGFRVRLVSAAQLIVGYLRHLETQFRWIFRMHFPSLNSYYFRIFFQCLFFIYFFLFLFLFSLICNFLLTCRRVWSNWSKPVQEFQVLFNHTEFYLHFAAVLITLGVQLSCRSVVINCILYILVSMYVYINFYDCIDYILFSVLVYFDIFNVGCPRSNA